MLQFICYIMPSFISVNIHKKINKENDCKKLITYYGVYCTLNNLMTLFLAVIKHLKDPYTFDMITVSFCFKYLAFATVFSIIMPYIIKVINNIIEIDVEVKKNEKRK